MPKLQLCLQTEPVSLSQTNLKCVQFYNMDGLIWRFNGHTSHLLNVNASIIQGSGVRSVMYVVNAADLQAVMPGNIMVKYADDTYLVSRLCGRDGASS